MTDPEAVLLCAEAMEYALCPDEPLSVWTDDLTKYRVYDPLTNGEQCLALVDWLLANHGALHFYKDNLLFYGYDGQSSIFQYPLHAAIVHCVAKAQAAKAAK